MSSSSSSFSNLMRSVSASGAAKPTGVVKKVKVQNTGSQIKKLAAIVNTANKSATAEAPKDHKVAPKPAELPSLQQMKEDALATLEQRRKALEAACAAIEPLKADSEAVTKAFDELEKQIEAIDADIAKLQLFGLGFKTHDIKGIDAQTFVALASWGLDVKKQFAPTADDKPVPAVEDAAVVDDDTSLDEVIMASLFGDEPLEKQPSPAPAEEKKTEPAPSPPKVAAKPAPPSKPRAQANFLYNPKRKPADAPMSRPLKPMGTVDPAKVPTTTTIIDAMEAHRAVELSIAAKKKQKGTKKASESVSKGAGTGEKSRFYRDKEGNMKLRKGKALTGAGEKRKRGDVEELPNKRVAVEGRDFSRLRAPRGVAPTSDATGAGFGSVVLPASGSPFMV